MQDEIHAQAEAAAAGDQLRQLIQYPRDRPATSDPLVGELDTHTGHGAFIAGIVRQVAPDAEVLSVRIMHSDGIVYEGDLTCALALLASRVKRALPGGTAEMVDAVCLSLGYFSESAADVAYSSGLRQVIAALLHCGTTSVIASVARVADESSMGQMTAHHQALRSGAGPAAALATSARAEPFSPFVCFGAG